MYDHRKTVHTICQQNPHPIFGNDNAQIKAQVFQPKPGKKRNRMNQKIPIHPNEKLDHDAVSYIGDLDYILLKLHHYLFIVANFPTIHIR